jgi:hypothetical protein
MSGVWCRRPRRGEGDDFASRAEHFCVLSRTGGPSRARPEGRSSARRACAAMESVQRLPARLILWATRRAMLPGAQPAAARLRRRPDRCRARIRAFEAVPANPGQRRHALLTAGKITGCRRSIHFVGSGAPGIVGRRLCRRRLHLAEPGGSDQEQHEDWQAHRNLRLDGPDPTPPYQIARSSSKRLGGWDQRARRVCWLCAFAAPSMPYLRGSFGEGVPATDVRRKKVSVGVKSVTRESGRCRLV